MQKAIRNGYVLVNDQLVKSKDVKVDPENDKIEFDGEVVFYKETVLLMLNKPSGYVCANKDGLHKTVFELIKEPYSKFDLNVAGRLDIDTEGLVLLTNNGLLLHDIISPSKKVYKKYFVRVDEPFKNPESLEGNYQIKDARDNLYTPLKPFVEKISETEFYLSICEGKFHQVKRMVAHFSRKVVYLKRVSIGDINLDEALELGEYLDIN